MWSEVWHITTEGAHHECTAARTICPGTKMSVGACRLSMFHTHWRSNFECRPSSRHDAGVMVYESYIDSEHRLVKCMQDLFQASSRCALYGVVSDTLPWGCWRRCLATWMPAAAYALGRACLGSKFFGDRFHAILLLFTFTMDTFSMNITISNSCTRLQTSCYKWGVNKQQVVNKQFSCTKLQQRPIPTEHSHTGHARNSANARVRGSSNAE